MEHARKMVLVPEENLLQLNASGQRQQTFTTEASQSQEAQTISATLSRLDTEMNEILNSNKYKDEREKWTAYLAVLQRYLHFVDSERTHQQLELLKKEAPLVGNEKKEETSTSMNDSIIIESVPQKFRSKAKLLLRRLHDARSPNFSWNAAGTVSIMGKPIKDSNIVDLMNDAMRARKISKPAGRKAFAGFLKAIKAPREFVGNEELWLESRANSTLQQQDQTGSSDVGDISDIDGQSSSYYSDDKSVGPSRSVQSGAGCYNKNKKRRVTWTSLKL